MSRCLVAYLNDLPQTSKQQLDLIFRLSFLEGVARLQPGEWSKRPKSGAVEARQWFEVNQIPMDSDWFALLPTVPWVIELDRRTYGMVERFPRDLRAIGWTAEDIIQNLISATTSPAGRRQDRVFYSFGLSQPNPSALSILNPTKQANKIIGAGLTRALAQFIRDLTQRKSNRPQLLQKDQPKDQDPKQTPWEDRMETSESSSRDPEVLLMDLLSEEMGSGRALLQIAGPAIDSIAKDEVSRFVLKRFFELLVDPRFNVFETSGVRDKRPNRSKLWAMMSKIRQQVQEDMLAKFDPAGTLPPEDREKLAKRIYTILGSGGRGSEGVVELPKGIEKVLVEIRKHPAIQQALKRYQQELGRMNLRTADLVRAFKFRSRLASMSLLEIMIFEPKRLA